MKQPQKWVGIGNKTWGMDAGMGSFMIAGVGNIFAFCGSAREHTDLPMQVYVESEALQAVHVGGLLCVSNSLATYDAIEMCYDWLTK